MTDAVKPKCPVCDAWMNWDGDDERYVCEGIVQHCYVLDGQGDERKLMLTASDSGEDAELFSTYPFVQQSAPAGVGSVETDVPCPVCDALMLWNQEEERYVCKGIVQHCYVIDGQGHDRKLMLMASDSGEDAEIFSTYPLPKR